MRIHNLYTDARGESHFRDLAVEWVEETRAGKLSKRLPATGIIFREVPPTYDLDLPIAAQSRDARLYVIPE